MTPKEYDCMTYYDISLKIEGYQDKRNREDEVSRLIAFSAYVSANIKIKKGFTPQKFWQLAHDKPEKKINFNAKKKGFMELLNMVKGVTKKGGK